MSRPEAHQNEFQALHIWKEDTVATTQREVWQLKVKGSRMIDVLEKLTIESNSSTSDVISSSEESTDDD